MSDKESLSTSLTRRVTDAQAALAELPAAERVVAAGGLFVLGRCASLLERMETLVEDQRASVRRGREILEMFPPLLGKLGTLLDLEIEGARGRLRGRPGDEDGAGRRRD